MIWYRSTWRPWDRLSCWFFREHRPMSDGTGINSPFCSWCGKALEDE